MESKVLLALKDYLIHAGASATSVSWMIFLITIFSIVFVAWIADWITKRITLSVIKTIAAKSKSIWDDILVEKRFFHRIALFVPTLLVYHMSGEALKGFEVVRHLIQLITLSYGIFVAMRVFDAFLNSAQEIYNTLPNAKNRSIKGYIQVTKIFIYFIGSIIILSIILDKNLGWFFTGLGAMAAILLLIFKDTILGLVGGIQLAANDMLRLGDWIEMPSRLADGTVIDISLNTVKVQNANMTITTIPTYALVNESFYNWRGIDDAGGRRIKRSIFIDMKSVSFIDEKTLNKFKKIDVLDRFISTREAESRDLSIESAGMTTNIGLFRKYLEFYLRNHAKIRQDMALVVRYRQPTENGLPIEIYVFSKEKKFKEFEDLQADIFDHILAVLPEFKLRVFQNPMGEDLSH